MARGINKTISIGNLCADPESRVMPNGNAVTNARIAMNDSYKDKNTGQVVEKVEYMSVVFFNRLAEIAGQYLKKGSQVYIEGSLRTRKWTDQNGQDRYTTEVVANEMQMIGGKGEAAGQSQQASAPARQGSQADSYRAASRGGDHKSQAHTSGGGGYADFDDDIPFLQHERGSVI